MPWKKESVVEQRMRFLIEARQREESMMGLCRRYEISRKTGYKWLKRYESKQSIEGLQDQSRRPQHSPRRTSGSRAEQVLAVRDKKGWGANKIAEVLANTGTVIPAITVHRILKRNGRIKAKPIVGIATKRFARGSSNGFQRGVHALGWREMLSTHLIGRLQPLFVRPVAANEHGSDAGPSGSKAAFSGVGCAGGNADGSWFYLVLQSQSAWPNLAIDMVDQARDQA